MKMYERLMNEKNKINTLKIQIRVRSLVSTGQPVIHQCGWIGDCVDKSWEALLVV